VITFGYATTGFLYKLSLPQPEMQNLTQTGIINEAYSQGGGSYQFANFDVRNFNMEGRR